MIGPEVSLCRPRSGYAARSETAPVAPLTAAEGPGRSLTSWRQIREGPAPAIGPPPRGSVPGRHTRLRSFSSSFPSRPIRHQLPGQKSVFSKFVRRLPSCIVPLLSGELNAPTDVNVAWATSVSRWTNAGRNSFAMRPASVYPYTRGKTRCPDCWMTRAIRSGNLAECTRPR